MTNQPLQHRHDQPRPAHVQRIVPDAGQSRMLGGLGECMAMTAPGTSSGAHGRIVLHLAKVAPRTTAGPITGRHLAPFPGVPVEGEATTSITWADQWPCTLSPDCNSAGPEENTTETLHT